MVVLAGARGAVGAAVVGVLAGLFGSSVIDKYGGFTESGQPRAREMGRAEYDEDFGPSEQIYNKMGSVDGDVDQSGAFMLVGISCHNVCRVISCVCSCDKACSSEGRDEGRAGQFRELAGDTAIACIWLCLSIFCGLISRCSFGLCKREVAAPPPILWLSLSRDVTPVTSPGCGRAAHLRAVPRRCHVE